MFTPTPSTHDEDQCHYVSTVGLSLVTDQRTVYYSRQEQYPFNFDNEVNDTVFVKSTHLIQFTQQALPRFKHPIILVTNGDDVTFPLDLPKDVFETLKNSPKVTAVFAQNNWAGMHHKFRSIPIGIDYHTLNWERGTHDWGTTGQLASQQETRLVAIKSTFPPIRETNPNKVVTNFHLAMSNPPRRRQIRERVWDVLQHVKSMVWLPQQTREEFWTSLRDCAFVLCPHGNGMDTHRAWEVLTLGRIPIVQALPINEVYKNLPVWEVTQWGSFATLTEADLRAKFDEFVAKWDTFEWERLTLKWWKEEFQRMKATAS